MRGVRGSQLERSFETWALSITKTTFLQRRVDFLSPRPTACCAPIESAISSGSYKFLRRTEPEVGSLRFLADRPQGSLKFLTPEVLTVHPPAPKQLQ